MIRFNTIDAVRTLISNAQFYFNGHGITEILVPCAVSQSLILI
jgi:hypothetical protein